MIRGLRFIDPHDYPWGITPEPGWRYFEAPAACGAGDHHGHPFCDPLAEERLRRAVVPGVLEIVRPPVLTDSGWLLLGRVFLGPVPSLGNLPEEALEIALEARRRRARRSRPSGPDAEVQRGRALARWLPRLEPQEIFPVDPLDAAEAAFLAAIDHLRRVGSLSAAGLRLAGVRQRDDWRLLAAIGRFLLQAADKGADLGETLRVLGYARLAYVVRLASVKV